MEGYVYNKGKHTLRFSSMGSVDRSVFRGEEVISEKVTRLSPSSVSLDTRTLGGFRPKLRTKTVNNRHTGYRLTNSKIQSQKSRHFYPYYYHGRIIPTTPLI